MALDPRGAATAKAFIRLAGGRAWARRIAEFGQTAAAGPHVRRALAQRHGLELSLERMARGLDRAPGVAERCVMDLARATLTAFASFPPAGQDRLRAQLHAGLSADGTLIPLFHLMRTATVQRARGFSVTFAALAEGAPFDLLLERDGAAAEVACDVVSAEDGRDVRRGAWVRLMDRIDPDLQLWLASHPGRYLLKVTLPHGLRADDGHQDLLAALHERIRGMLAAQRRADHDEAAVLRLDPLMLAGAQAGELGLLDSLRREFGHEAHLAVTEAGGGVFVMAARSGRENEVAVAIRRRMAAVAPARLSGRRAGILAMFVEDTDRAEWRHLRERLELEGEARQFLTFPEARSVVAVTYTSRLELLGAVDAVPDGELRFRNPAHPAARAPGLAPAVLSSM
jgi:hypothetical protein